MKSTNNGRCNAAQRGEKEHRKVYEKPNIERKDRKRETAAKRLCDRAFLPRRKQRNSTGQRGKEWLLDKKPCRLNRPLRSNLFHRKKGVQDVQIVLQPPVK